MGEIPADKGIHLADINQLNDRYLQMAGKSPRVCLRTMAANLTAEKQGRSRGIHPYTPPNLT